MAYLSLLFGVLVGLSMRNTSAWWRATAISTLITQFIWVVWAAGNGTLLSGEVPGWGPTLMVFIVTTGIAAWLYSRAWNMPNPASSDADRIALIRQAFGLNTPLEAADNLLGASIDIEEDDTHFADATCRDTIRRVHKQLVEMRKVLTVS